MMKKPKLNSHETIVLDFLCTYFSNVSRSYLNRTFLFEELCKIKRFEQASLNRKLYRYYFVYLKLFTLEELNNLSKMYKAVDSEAYELSLIIIAKKNIQFSDILTQFKRDDKVYKIKVK